MMKAKIRGFEVKYLPHRRFKGDQTMKLYEMPNTVVLLRSKAEYDEYNELRQDAGWHICMFSWERMYLNRWRYHKIQATSNSLDKKYVEREKYHVLTFSELQELLRKRPPAKKPRKKRPAYWVEIFGPNDACSIVLRGRNDFLMLTPYKSYKTKSRANQQAKRLAEALGIEFRRGKQ